MALAGAPADHPAPALAHPATDRTHRGIALAGLDEADQRLLEWVFTRAFSHVLRENKKSDDIEPQWHRDQDMEKAISSFRDRQDRKRSDETFVALFRELEPLPRDLPDHYLFAAP